MTPLQLLAYLLVATGGTAVALTRDPKRQALVLSLFGMALTVLFLALQAPDVALSELAVGAAALPLMLLVALANIHEERSEADSTEEGRP